MLKFKRQNCVPPGGLYFWQVPGGPFLSSRMNLNDVEVQAMRWYSLNRQPVPENLRAVIEDFICRNVADGFCEGDDDGRPMSPWRHLTYWQLVGRTRATLRGQALVPEETAEARSTACLSCANNLRHMCTTCNGLDGFASGLVGGRKLRARDYLGACAASGSLLAAVLFREQAPNTAGVSLPDGCWMKQES